MARQLAEVDKTELARTLRTVETMRDEAMKAARFRRQEAELREAGDAQAAKGKASAATKAEKSVQRELREAGLEPSQRDVQLIGNNQDEFARFRDILEAEGLVEPGTVNQLQPAQLASRLRQFADTQSTRRRVAESRAFRNATAKAASSARRDMELAERAEDQEEQLVEDALNDARARIEDADEDEAVEDLQRGVEEAEEEDRFVREVEDCLRRTSE
jgi:hypothetical protein